MYCKNHFNADILRICVECKCANCGKIKFRKALETVIVKDNAIDVV